MTRHAVGHGANSRPRTHQACAGHARDEPPGRARPSSRRTRPRAASDAAGNPGCRKMPQTPGVARPRDSGYPARDRQRILRVKLGKKELPP
jgi:hypothetical protein